MHAFERILGIAHTFQKFGHVVQTQFDAAGSESVQPTEKIFFRFRFVHTAVLFNEYIISPVAGKGGYVSVCGQAFFFGDFPDQIHCARTVLRSLFFRH